MGYFPQARRVQSTPILARGGTYDGIFADALAAPYITWDGTRFVLGVSAWNTANGKWYQVFLTASTLTGPWTYVTGSIKAPSGSDFIFGNAGLAWWKGKYWCAYTHHQYSQTEHPSLMNSTDLVNWTTVADPIAGITGFDPGCNVNPVDNTLELWLTTEAHTIIWYKSSDGTAWTSQGTYLSTPNWSYNNGSSNPFGECHAYVHRDGKRYVTADVNTHSNSTSIDDGYRLKGLFVSPQADVAFSTNGTTNGTVLGANALNSWESVQVFDGHIVGAFNLGNGLGEVLYLTYAGGDNNSPGDNTSSSIGLAWLPIPDPQTSTPLPKLLNLFRHRRIG